MKINVRNSTLCQYGLAAFMGIGLGCIADLHFFQWKFYAILIPTMILVGLMRYYHDKGE